MTTEPLTAARLAEIRGRADAAIEGPWNTRAMSVDMDLIAHARTDIPDLLDELERAREIIRDLVVHMDQVDVGACCVELDCPFGPAHDYLEATR